MFQEIYFNNSVENWLISVAIIVGALCINWFITYVNAKHLKSLASKTKTIVDDILVNTLETPLKVGIFLIAIWTAFHRLNLSEKFETTLYSIYEILTVLNITWFIANLLRGLLKEHFDKKAAYLSNKKSNENINSHISVMLQKAILFVVWTIGIVASLSNVGIDIKAILGTLGLGGIALALAAQDTVKNIFGGFTALFDGTFRIGDTVKIGEFEGTVEDIGIRSTKIRNYDKRIVTIPNFKIVEEAVTNLSVAPQFRVIANLGLVYTTPIEKLEQAIQILIQIAKENPRVSNDDISAVFENFGDFSLNIRFCYYIPKKSGKLNTMSEVNFEILKQFRENNIELAFPTQNLIVEKA